MSDGAAAPAPAPAAPAAGQGAPSTAAPAPAPGKARERSSRSDAFADAAKDLRERRKLRLAPSPGTSAGDGADSEDPAKVAKAARERARQQQQGANGEPDGNPSDDAPAGTTTTADPDEPADEAKPHWAKKLQAEHAAATAEIARLKEHVAKHDEAVRSMRYAHEDAVDEARFRAGLANDLNGLLSSIPMMVRVGTDAKGRALFAQKIGENGQPLTHAVDPVSVRALVAERQGEVLKRQIQRGQGKDLDGMSRSMSADLQAKFGALIQRHPELDPKKNPSAKDWLEDELHRWQRNDGKWDEAGASSRAARFALALKAEASARAQPPAGQQKTPPKPTQRPATTSSTPANNGAGTQPRTGTVERAGVRTDRYVDDKQIKREIRANRASNNSGQG